MAALAAMVGCAMVGTASAAPANTKVANSAITIGFVPSLASDPFFISMQYGAQQEAKALGVKLIWQGPTGVYSPSAQLPFVSSVLAKHPNAFILVPTDAKALMPSVEQAKGMGIPVLTVDTTVVNTSILASHITGDNAGGGALAAQLLSTALGGKGEVFVMSGSPGTTTDALRLQGFSQAVKTKYTGLKDEGVQYSSDQPSTAESDVEHELARFPYLGGIFAVDDTDAEGTIAALKAENRVSSVSLVTYDAEPTEVTSLRAGQLIGVVAQRPAVEGSLAVLYAYDEVVHHTSGVRHAVIVPDILLQRKTLSSDTKWFYCVSLGSCHIAWQPTASNIG
jgi:ribose transport system substrate-binding protein